MKRNWLLCYTHTCSCEWDIHTRHSELRHKFHWRTCYVCHPTTPTEIEAPARLATCISIDMYALIMQHTPPLSYCLSHLYSPMHPLPPQCPLLTELDSNLYSSVITTVRVRSICLQTFPAHNWIELTLCNVALSFIYYFSIWKKLCKYYAWSVYISYSTVPCPTGVWRDIQ